MTDRELMQQALDALLTWKTMHPHTVANAVRTPAIEALRARLAQGEQEPVAVVDANDEGYWADILPDRSVKVGQLLYTAPPQREWLRAIKGVRVEGDKVIVAAGSNDAARLLCELLVREKNA